MPVNLAMAAMTVLEFVLWTVLAIVFWKKKLQRRFPYMSAYLALHVASSPVLILLLELQTYSWGKLVCYAAYFYVFYAYIPLPTRTAVRCSFQTSRSA